MWTIILFAWRYHGYFLMRSGWTIIYITSRTPRLLPVDRFSDDLISIAIAYSPIVLQTHFGVYGHVVVSSIPTHFRKCLVVWLVQSPKSVLRKICHSVSFPSLVDLSGTIYSSYHFYVKWNSWLFFDEILIKYLVLPSIIPNTFRFPWSKDGIVNETFASANLHLPCIVELATVSLQLLRMPFAYLHIIVRIANRIWKHMCRTQHNSPYGRYRGFTGCIKLMQGRWNSTNCKSHRNSSKRSTDQNFGDEK